MIYGRSLLQVATAFLTFAPAWAAEEPRLAEVRVTTELRAAPNLSSKVVHVIPGEAAIEVLTCREEWCHVSYATQVGWLPADRIRDTPDRAAELSAGRPGPGLNTAGVPAAGAPGPPGPLSREVPLSSLINREVEGARGEQIGEVERIVVGGEGRLYAVVEAGGFLGVGERRVALPLARLAVGADRLVLLGMTVEDVRASPAWSASGIQEVPQGTVAPMQIVP